MSLIAGLTIGIVTAQGDEFIPWKAFTPGATESSSYRDLRLQGAFEGTVGGQMSSEEYELVMGYHTGLAAGLEGFAPPVPPTPTPSRTAAPRDTPTPTATPSTGEDRTPVVTPDTPAPFDTSSPTPVLTAEESPGPDGTPDQDAPPVTNRGPNDRTGVGCSAPSSGGSLPVDLSIALVLGLPLLWRLRRKD